MSYARLSVLEIKGLNALRAITSLKRKSTLYLNTVRKGIGRVVFEVSHRD